MNDSLESATAYFKNGRIREAEQICRSVLVADPDNVNALMLVSYCLGSTSRKIEALEIADRILSIVPSHLEALLWRSNKLRELNRLPEATKAAQRAVESAPESASAFFTLGLCYLTASNLSGASNYLEKAVELNPKAANYRWHLGLALDRQNSLPKAAEQFRAAIKLKSTDPSFYVALGQVCKRMGDTEGAIDAFTNGLKLKESPYGFAELAELQIRAGQFEKAEISLTRSIELDSNLGIAHELLGILLEETGRFDEADRALTKAYDLQPEKASILYRLARSKRFTDKDRPFIDQLNFLLGSPKSNEDQRRYLDYALGKVYDDLGEYEAAIRHYDEANSLSCRLQFAGKKYPVDEFRTMFASIKKRFTSSFFERHRDLGSPSETPVFIVGMLRSGTTLVEQILSSHLEVAAGGELPFWLETPAVEALRAIIDRKDQHGLNDLSRRYLEALTKNSPNCARVTDKMPNNYMALGLAHLLYPEGRIIHCRRNPLDNCLSIYMTVFSDPPKFAYDRKSIVAAYELYSDLMNHWEAVIPRDRYMTVDYEDLVADRESTTRRMIEFCGLAWDDRCLRHDQNKRPVNTPSLWQVRQPIYATSVQRWKNYEPWLGEFELLRAN